MELANPDPASEDLYYPTQFSQPFFVQVQACFWKQWWTYWRSPPYNMARFLFTVGAAFLFGTIFWNLGKQTYAPRTYLPTYLPGRSEQLIEWEIMHSFLNNWCHVTVLKLRTRAGHGSKLCATLYSKQT
jgi:hypothetical protein